MREEYITAKTSINNNRLSIRKINNKLETENKEHDFSEGKKIVSFSGGGEKGRILFMK